MSDIPLNWQGPLSFRELIASRESRIRYNVPGVYLWKTTDSQPRIIYVGKAGSVYQRQLEHYQLFVSATYMIPASYRRVDTDWAYDLSKNHELDDLFEKDQFLELAEAGFDFAASLKVFFAEVKDGSMRRSVESALIFDLQPERNVQGKASPPPSAPILLHGGAVDQLNLGLSTNQQLVKSHG